MLDQKANATAPSSGFGLIAKPKQAGKLLYLDILRCISILGVLGVHLIMDLELSPVSFLPSADGVYSNLSDLFTYREPAQSFSDVISHLVQLPLKLGWQGVHTFIFISGFGLYLSYLNRKNTESSAENKSQLWLSWLRRRFNRVLPKYWVVITVIFVSRIVFATFDWVSGAEPISRFAVLSVQYLKSLFVTRGLTQASFFSLAGALWYIPLTVGLYISLPLIITFMERRNIRLFEVLLLSVVSTLLFRFIVNLDPCSAPVPFDPTHAACPDPWDWNMHKIFSIHVLYGIFLARLPTFVLGMYAAELYKDGKLDSLTSTFRKRSFLLLFSSAIWVAGNLTSYYKATWPLCDFLLGLGLAGITLSLLYWEKYHIGRGGIACVKTISKISYELFLTHQFIFYILSRFIHPDLIGYTSFSFIYILSVFGISYFLNASTESLTIDNFPVVKDVYNWVEKLVEKKLLKTSQPL